MRLAQRLLVFVTAIFLAAASKPAAADGPPICPPDSFPHPETWECVGIVDATAGQGYEVEVPDLAEMRDQQAIESLDGPPVPGSFQAGTIYKNGELQAPNGATFFTHMTVFPGGIRNIGNWYFHTATNRMDWGVEVVGIYAGDANGTLGVFDWACHRDERGHYEVEQIDPCQNPTRGYQITESLKHYSCNYKSSNVLGGNWHLLMHYQNVTEKLDSGNPPLWRNRVLLFNYCTQVFDEIYSHRYRGVAADCSDGSCASWAGVHETFWPSHPFPPVPYGGFWRQGISIPGGFTDFLTPAVTDFIQPPPEWTLAAFTSNHSYTAGSFVDSDGDGVGDASDADDDGDGVADLAEPPCGAHPLHPYRRPERNDPPFALADDDGDTLVDEALPTGTSAYDCDGDGFIGSVEQHVFSFTNNVADQDPCGTTKWPADLVSGSSGSISYNKVNLLDLASFVAPEPRHLNTSPGDPGYHVRWDVVPGPSGLWERINIMDMATTISVVPPMLGVRAFNGPPCPWPP